MYNFTLEDIFKVRRDEEFESLALKYFHYHAESNLVYKEYLSHLKIEISKVVTLDQIPFLPIELYKTHKVVSSEEEVKVVFYSSGTSGMERSQHHVISTEIYEQSFTKSFSLFYPDWKAMPILALLPNYLENSNSSLVYMVKYLMDKSNQAENEFYLDNVEKLIQTISELESKGRPYFLFGVSYALLDLAEQFSPVIKHGIIIETGGMKGRRREITRQELHSSLVAAFKTDNIHSEYGMTELLSQAYSMNGGKYKTPPWMRIYIRDIYDPFAKLDVGKSGGVNIIDLANLYSCPFIETKDLGRINEDGTFEILGRFDQSDIRGCNLLIEE